MQKRLALRGRGGGGHAPSAVTDLVQEAHQEDGAQLGHGQRHGHLGVRAGLRRHVVEPLGQMDVLSTERAARELRSAEHDDLE